jgi:leucyl aminopeptidase
VWRFPLWEEYTEQISSEIADIKNTGGRPGGAITAGAFLKEFVGDVPWIHLDIAGTASEVPVSYVPHKELPTGVGVRLVLETLRRWV